MIGNNGFLFFQSKTFAQESPVQLMKAVKNTVERRRYKECQVANYNKYPKTSRKSITVTYLNGPPTKYG